MASDGEGSMVKLSEGELDEVLQKVESPRPSVYNPLSKSLMFPIIYDPDKGRF